MATGDDGAGPGAGRPACLQVVVEFPRDLLGHFDVPQWNRFAADLFGRGLLGACWAPSERPPPLVVLLDFHRLQRPRYRLDGIDLSLCWLADADFTGASLRRARLGCGRNISYRGARLDGADFSGGVEISGCDFTGCRGLDTIRIEGATYDPGNPPVGLPPGLLALCKPDADPPPSDPRAPANPREPTGFREAPLRCSASIHLSPLGA